MPPKAAVIGRRAFLSEERRPINSSRLISSPTTKKKITIRPSLIQWWTDNAYVASPHETPIFVCRSSVYDSAQGELAQTRASRVQAKRTMLPETSERKKRSKSPRDASFPWDGLF